MPPPGLNQARSADRARARDRAGAQRGPGVVQQGISARDRRQPASPGAHPSVIGASVTPNMPTPSYTTTRSLPRRQKDIEPLTSIDDPQEYGAGILGLDKSLDRAQKLAEDRAQSAAWSAAQDIKDPDPGTMLGYDPPTNLVNLDLRQLQEFDVEPHPEFPAGLTGPITKMSSVPGYTGPTTGPPGRVDMTRDELGDRTSEQAGGGEQAEGGIIDDIGNFFGDLSLKNFLPGYTTAQGLGYVAGQIFGEDWAVANTDLDIPVPGYPGRFGTRTPDLYDSPRGEGPRWLPPEAPLGADIGLAPPVAPQGLSDAESTAGLRRDLTGQLGDIFPGNAFPADDPAIQLILQAILDERRDAASRSVDVFGGGGTNLNPQGLQTFNEDLGLQAPRVLEDITNVAGGVGSTNQGILDAIRDRAAGQIGDFQFGDLPFDLSPFAIEREESIAASNAARESDIIAALGSENFNPFNVGDAIQAAIRAQGVVSGGSPNTLLAALASIQGGAPIANRQTTSGIF